jgi:hypothetical protein
MHTTPAFRERGRPCVSRVSLGCRACWGWCYLGQECRRLRLVASDAAVCEVEPVEEGVVEWPALVAGAVLVDLDRVKGPAGVVAGGVSCVERDQDIDDPLLAESGAVALDGVFRDGAGQAGKSLRFLIRRGRRSSGRRSPTRRASGYRRRRVAEGNRAASTPATPRT